MSNFVELTMVLSYMNIRVERVEWTELYHPTLGMVNGEFNPQSGVIQISNEAEEYARTLCHEATHALQWVAAGSVAGRMATLSSLLTSIPSEYQVSLSDPRITRYETRKQGLEVLAYSIGDWARTDLQAAAGWLVSQFEVYCE